VNITKTNSIILNFLFYTVSVSMLESTVGRSPYCECADMMNDAEELLCAGPFTANSTTHRIETRNLKRGASQLVNSITLNIEN